MSSNITNLNQLKLILNKFAGKYIVFEGLDGSGKTTQLNWILEQATKIQQAVISIREPGSTEQGEKIRDILLNSNYKLQPLTELFLFMAARSELLHQQIIPALQAQQTVISDRSYISTYAYQILPNHIDSDYFYATVEQIYQAQQIDLIVYFKVDCEKGLARSRAVRNEDSMEAKGLEFYKKIEQGYNSYLSNFMQQAQLIHQHQDYQLYKLQAKQQFLLVINAEQDIEQVRQSLLSGLAFINF